MSVILVLSLLGFVGYLIGKGKGMGGVGFFLGFILGPIGWFIVMATSGNKKQCNYCKQQIHFQASICPYCKKDNPFANEIKSN